MHLETQAIHTGVYADQTYNSVTTPIYPSSNFYFDRVGVTRGYDYTRSGNPTRHALEQNLAALEGGAACVATATGMAAISSAMFLLESGDHVIAGNDIYGGTYRLFSQLMPRMNITFSFIDMRDPAAVEQAIQPNTRCLWIETPSNPLLNIHDVTALCEIAKKHDLLAITDNTFLSPVFQQPLALGADIVIHSTTKYLNGHSDVVGGAIISKDQKLAERVGYVCNALGTACSPFDAFLVLRGVKTLAPRMATHQHNAQTLAEWLDTHPQVRQVYYPGLPAHPQHALAKQQQTGFGGMLAFEIDADAEKMDTFFENLHLFLLAESLGGVESLIEQPWTMSHASMGEKGLAASGITPQTVRVSVGLEHVDDLKADLQRGFEAIQTTPASPEPDKAAR